MSLELTDAALDAIVDAGYDPAFGARPLKRYIQSHLETLIAKRLLSGEAVQTLRVDADEA